MIDKRTLNYISGLPDDKLEQMVRLFASGCGVELSKKRLDRRTVAGLRCAAEAVTEADIARVSELIDVYKKGKRC